MIAKIVIFAGILLLLGCTQQNFSVPDNGTGLGLHFSTLSAQEGISGIYISNNSVYFQAIRGKERNPRFERLSGAPLYPIDVRFVSVECNDPFITAVGGSELENVNWYPENQSTACEGEKRMAEFRTAWKIADELEKLPIPAELKWEKEALIMEARAVKESDLYHPFTPTNIE